MREEWDARVADCARAGEVWREERDRGEVDGDLAELVSLEGLRPGEAVGKGRKRGWREGVDLGDWSRGFIRA